MRYPVAIELGGETAYGVAVPDIPEAFSAGDTLDEALANARDAILLALEDYVDRGDAIPVPSALEGMVKSRSYRGWTWAVVDVDLAKLSTKAVRINITVPDRLLGSIDAYAASHGETRSGFLTRAAMEAMVD